MKYLSNAEVYNRWSDAKKQEAKQYWHDFLLSRYTNYNDEDAKRYINHMELSRIIERGTHEQSKERTRAKKRIEKYNPIK